MNKKTEEPYLDMSMKDVASILQSGRKITRNTKNQLKMYASQKQIIQGQSQMSFDSKKSIQAKKAPNKQKKKQGQKQKRIGMSKFGGIPDLQSYIETQTLEIKTTFSTSLKFRLAQLHRVHLPNLIRVFLKMTDQLYQIKKGELKKQKSANKQQYIVDFQYNNRSEMRTITREYGFIMVGQNLVMAKLNFDEFKKMFKSQLNLIMIEAKRTKSSQNLQTVKQNEKQEKYDQTIQKNQQQQSSLENIQRRKQQIKQSLQQANQDINDKNLSIDQIKEIQSLEFVEIRNDGGNYSFVDSSKIIQQSGSKDFIQIDKQKEKNQIEITQQQIFDWFCIPGFNYVLWPSLICQCANASNQEIIQILKQNQYYFYQKQQSKLFQRIFKCSGILKSSDLLEQQKNKCQSYIQGHKSVFTSQYLAQKSKKTVSNRPQQQCGQKQKLEQGQMNQKSSQSSSIAYLFGSNKFIDIQHKDLISWQAFAPQFLQEYFSRTHFEEMKEQICQSVEQLNLFAKQQISQCKLDDMRLVVDRISKCMIDNKVYNAIPLRYSHSQKKILVMLFSLYSRTQNELTWVTIQQIYPNYTVPQITTRGKLILYFSNCNIFNNNKSLTMFITDAYSTFFYQQYNINRYISNHVQNLKNIQEQEDTHQSNSKINRCFQCFYPIYNIEHYQCCFCGKFCHRQCTVNTINNSIQLNFQNQANLWTCNQCEPCNLCLQPLANKRLTCQKCQNKFHQVCGKLKTQEITTSRQKYLCQNCIQCKICSKKLKNSEYFIIKGSYQCSTCRKAQLQNQSCHICKNVNVGDGRWIQCSRQFCQKWIHKYCDKFLLVKNFFFQNNQQIYFCPNCRKVQRRKIILKCIEILTTFDQYQYFIGSDYQDILDYRFVIMNSMCFRKMNERCLQGAYDQKPYEDITNDFDLIISNALKYNMPKDQPHYQARILNILGKFSLQKLKQQIQCSQQQIISGVVYQKIVEKRKQIYKQIQERYLQIILNYKSHDSFVEVRKPKQKNEKQIPNLQENFVFSSRFLLNQVFKSSMLKFKIKKKIPKLQNLFEIQKVVEAFKSPIKQNLCYYHYWNSNVIFYCQICMEYYCCTDVCFKHNICNICGIKGCACDMYQCGCPPLKQKERKTYQKLIHDRFYEKRQITENFKLCLRCAFQKLNSKICCYCQKSYQFYYDFQTCIYCKKIYHKQCADAHASQNLSNFFFKKQKNSPPQQLYSNTLRLDNSCYECSISSSNRLLMNQKHKKQSKSKLIKLHKLGKYMYLMFAIFSDNGIKQSINDIFNLIVSYYDEFLKYQNLFDEYKNNICSIRFYQLNNRRFEEKVEQKVKREILEKNMNLSVFGEKNERSVKRDNERRLILNSDKMEQQKQANERQSQKIEEANFLFKYSNKEQNQFGEIYLEEQSITLFDKQAFIRQNSKKLRDIYLNYSLIHQNNGKFIETNIRFQKVIQKFQQSKKKMKYRKIITEQYKQLTYLPTSNNLKKNTNNSSSSLNKIANLFKNRQILQTNFIPLEQIQIQSIFQLRKHMKQKYCLLTFSNQNTDLLKIKFKFSSPIISYINKCVQSQKEEIDIQENQGRQTNNFLQEKKMQQQQIIIPKDTYFMRHKNSSQKVKKQQEKKNEKPIQKEKKPQNLQEKNPQYWQLKEQLLIKYLMLMNNSAAQNDKTQKQHLVQQQESVSTQFSMIQQKLMKIHIDQTNISKLSKLKRLSTIYKIISKFLLKCFQESKSVYRRGNTCLLKSQIGNWRVYKKGKSKGQSYQITLKKQSNRWYFSINQNIWIIDSIEQIISKLKFIVQLSNFRELADFLGFTFKCIPSQKAIHFTKLLRTNPLDDLNPETKKKIIMQVYDKYQWLKNGYFKTKKMNNNEQETKQFIVNRKKPFYLKKKNQKCDSSIQRYVHNPPYITHQDLKKDLEDVSVLMQKQKIQKIVLCQPGDTVFIAPSPIHKLGLFAKEKYRKHTTMVQYIGEIVSESVADVRESKFHFGCYMFGLNRRNVDKRQIIDATFRGNMARYLNHSCQPNCKAKIQMVNNQPRIFIYSIRDINQYEELTYDYQFSIDANEKIICTCGAKNCQGRLN